ncbi:MAG TPA: hypothetical protein VNA89_08435 [Gemmatimonadaceae bacterium]|nr:hypothetical protein [Gemmatimonadaceae bacterium]
MRRLRRHGPVLLAVVAAAAAAFGAPVLARQARAGVSDPHATMLTGEYWQRLTPAERQVYLAGFLAGAAAEQARALAGAAGRAGDSVAVSSTAIDSLRRARSLHFRFGPAVYSAQVDDYYWWHNHRARPIVDALIFFNREMLKQQEEGRP